MKKLSHSQRKRQIRIAVLRECNATGGSAYAPDGEGARRPSLHPPVRSTRRAALI
jgi:hypothetical protein